LDLPPAQRQSIGIYGIGASSHATELRLIRHLIEERDFLKAGERTLIVIGATFQLGREEPGYFGSLLRRRGLFEITPDDRMVLTPISPLRRRLEIERARSGGFIWNAGRVAKNWVKAHFGTSRAPSHNPAKYRQGWREYMGPNWQQGMDAQMERLRETIALVRSHHAQIRVMLLPQATWMDELPFQQQYEMKIRALCEATSTPLIDFSNALPDKDFIDSSHLTVAGQDHFRRLVMDKIMGHLQKVETRLDDR
jgi:hypothetical protein